jgi:hypothetical protein
MKPIFNKKTSLVAYENNPNATRRELRSKSGGLLAWYDQNTDRTFDRSGNHAGTGDQRGKFIPNE